MKNKGLYMNSILKKVKDLLLPLLFGGTLIPATLLDAKYQSAAQTNAQQAASPKSNTIAESDHFKDFHDSTAVVKWINSHQVKTLGIGFINEGSLKHIKVYGHQAHENSIFNVASLTKPVTAMVALKLVSQGKLDLDEPLAKYWQDPDIKYHAWLNKITTRYVLSHQVGFPNWRWNLKPQKLDFLFEPGTQYQYSGEGYEYLRKALENKFGRNLLELAKELIFKPLDMPDTDYIWKDKTVASRFVQGFDKDQKPYPMLWNTNINAADDLHTTLDDYAKFLLDVLKGAGLDAKLFQQMQTKQVSTKPHKGFGLGFEIYELNNNDIVLAHGGADEGTRCIFFLQPKLKKGVIIFTNSDQGVQLYEAILNYYMGAVGKRIIAIEME